MSAKMMSGLVLLWAASWGFGELADAFIPGAQWPVFIVWAGVLTGGWAIAMKRKPTSS